MPERDRPDIEHTREEMRRHDARVAEDPAEPDSSEESGADEADEDADEDEG